MTPVIRWGYLVRSDLQDIVEFIQKDSPESALRFLQSADKAFSMLADSPEMGTLCSFKSPRISNARLWTIKGFRRYIVIYRPVAGGIEILRVLHGSRDFNAIMSDM